MSDDFDDGGDDSFRKTIYRITTRLADRLADPEYIAEQEKRRVEELKWREEQAKAEALEKERQRRVRLVERGIPVKDVEALVNETLRDTAALNIARGWWETDSTCLVLSGTRGCGKTTAAAWCVAQPYREDPYRDKDAWRYQRESPREWQSPLFLDVTKLQRASRYDDEKMLEIEMASTLAIDDLGMEYADAKGSFAALFDGLFNTRYANAMKTVITTNLTAADFKARYGERVADRIRECGRFVELNEQSLRGKP